MPIISGSSVFNLIFKVPFDDCIMEEKLKSAGCTIYDRVIRMIEGEQPHVQVCLYLVPENFKI